MQFIDSFSFIWGANTWPTWHRLSFYCLCNNLPGLTEVHNSRRQLPASGLLQNVDQGNEKIKSVAPQKRIYSYGVEVFCFYFEDYPTRYSIWGAVSIGETHVKTSQKQ